MEVSVVWGLIEAFDPPIAAGCVTGCQFKLLLELPPAKLGGGAKLGLADGVTLEVP
jgi:hypothetical protein